MSRRFLTTVLAIALLSLPGKAAVYSLDFSGTSTREIPGMGSLITDFTVNGVTFHYDNAGSTLGDTAYADATGVYGSTFGSLIMTFDSNIYGLLFDFTINNVLPGDVSGAVSADFYTGGVAGTLVGNVSADGTFVPYGDPYETGDSVGEFAFNRTGLESPAPADTVVLWFNPVASQTGPGGDDGWSYVPNQFNMSNITYGTAADDVLPAPEPGTWVMMISGVMLTGLGRYHKQQRARA